MVGLQAINEQLAAMRVSERYKSSWEQRLNHLNTLLTRETAKREQCRELLMKEQKDVDRLSGMTLGALFYSMLGQKEEKLTKEAEQLLQAKLMYDEAAENVQDLEEERDELQHKLAGLQHLEVDIQSLLDRKEQLILAHYPDLARQLTGLSHRETELMANLKEWNEAISAGSKVLTELNRAKELLESAKNWGTWDLLGGGMLSTAIKHGRIDDARSAIHSAQRSLRRFEVELVDVQRHASIQIEIGGLLTFADYFFDGLIADWIVQGRLSDSLQQIADKRSQVGLVVSELKTEVSKMQVELQAVRGQSQAIIDSV